MEILTINEMASIICKNECKYGILIHRNEYCNVNKLKKALKIKDLTKILVYTRCLVLYDTEFEAEFAFNNIDQADVYALMISNNGDVVRDNT